MSVPVKRQRTASANYPTSAKIRQLVDAVKEAGLKVGAVEFSPDGTVRFMSDKVVQATPASSGSAYDDWKNAGA